MKRILIILLMSIVLISGAYAFENGDCYNQADMLRINSEMINKQSLNFNSTGRAGWVDENLLMEIKYLEFNYHESRDLYCFTEKTEVIPTITKTWANRCLASYTGTECRTWVWYIIDNKVNEFIEEVKTNLERYQGGNDDNDIFDWIRGWF